MPRKKSTKIMEIEAPKKNIAISEPGDSLSGISVKQLKLYLKEEAEKREILKEYINSALNEGTDYGRIHRAKNCQYHKFPNLQSKCPSTHFFHKPSLYKPGAEKFCNLLKLTAVYFKDEESYLMVPQAIRKNGIFV